MSNKNSFNMAVLAASIALAMGSTAAMAATPRRNQSRDAARKCWIIADLARRWHGGAC